MNKGRSKKDLRIQTLTDQLQQMHLYLQRIYDLAISDNRGMNYSTEAIMSEYKSLAEHIMSQNGMEVD